MHLRETLPSGGLAILGSQQETKYRLPQDVGRNGIPSRTDYQSVLRASFFLLAALDSRCSWCCSCAGPCRRVHRSGVHRIAASAAR
jgi:hypothetical protein